VRVSIPIWVIVCTALVLVALCITAGERVSDLTPPFGRNLNELTRKLQVGMTQQEVVRRLGPPHVVTSSLAHLEPYRVHPPKSEQVLLYGEYPWGILVYVDRKQQRVTRLILVRHP